MPNSVLQAARGSLASNVAGEGRPTRLPTRPAPAEESIVAHAGRAELPAEAPWADAGTSSSESKAASTVTRRARWQTAARRNRRKHHPVGTWYKADRSPRLLAEKPAGNQRARLPRCQAERDALPGVHQIGLEGTGKQDAGTYQARAAMKRFLQMHQLPPAETARAAFRRTLVGAERNREKARNADAGLTPRREQGVRHKLRTAMD